MQDCLQLDLPPHPDPYGPPRPVTMYPSMPLSPPGECPYSGMSRQVGGGNTVSPAGRTSMTPAALTAATAGEAPEGPGLLEIALSQNHGGLGGIRGHGGRTSPPVTPQPHHPPTPTSPHRQNPDYSSPSKPGTSTQTFPTPIQFYSFRRQK